MAGRQTFQEEFEIRGSLVEVRGSLDNGLNGNWRIRAAVGEGFGGFIELVGVLAEDAENCIKS